MPYGKEEDGCPPTAGSTLRKHEPSANAMHESLKWTWPADDDDHIVAGNRGMPVHGSTSGYNRLPCPAQTAHANYRNKGDCQHPVSENRLEMTDQSMHPLLWYASRVIANRMLTGKIRALRCIHHVDETGNLACGQRRCACECDGNCHIHRGDQQPQPTLVKKWDQMKLRIVPSVG